MATEQEQVAAAIGSLVKASAATIVSIGALVAAGRAAWPTLRDAAGIEPKADPFGGPRVAERTGRPSRADAARDVWSNRPGS